MTDPDAVAREQVVAAPPGEVFRWFVDPDLHQPGVAQHLEVLGGGRAGHRHRLGQLRGRPLGVPDQLQHGPPRGMGERSQGVIDRHWLSVSAIKR